MQGIKARQRCCPVKNYEECQTELSEYLTYSYILYYNKLIDQACLEDLPGFESNDFIKKIQLTCSSTPPFVQNLVYSGEML